jgi:hypothetical protein
MLSSAAFPCRVDANKVDVIEGEVRSAGSRRVVEMVLVRDSLIGPTGFVAALGVIPVAPPERPGESSGDVLVGEEAYARS